MCPLTHGLRSRATATQSIILLLLGVAPLAAPSALNGSWPPAEPLQSAEISGSVVDSSGTPLSGAQVQLVDGSASTFSGAQGEFALSVPGSGDYLVLCALAGYVPTSTRATVDVATGLDHHEIEFELVPIAPAVVIGPSGGSITAPTGEVLTLPAGALAADTPISFTPLPGHATSDAPALTQFSMSSLRPTGFHLEPHGLTLATPAVISFPIPVEADGLYEFSSGANDLTARFVDPATSDLTSEEIGVAVDFDSATATLSVPHFSELIIYDDFGPFDFVAHFVIISGPVKVTHLSPSAYCDCNQDPCEAPDVALNFNKSAGFSVTHGTEADLGVGAEVGVDLLAKLKTNSGIKISSSVTASWTSSFGTTIHFNGATYPHGPAAPWGWSGPATTRIVAKEITYSIYEQVLFGQAQLETEFKLRYDFDQENVPPTPCVCPPQGPPPPVGPGDGKCPDGQIESEQGMFSISTVLQEGDLVPGVGTVTRIDNLAVNDVGSWIVEADTDHSNTDADSVLVRDGVLLLREGDPLALPVGASLDSFDSLGINDPGDSAWNFFLDGTAGTNDDSGVYFGTQLLIQEGDLSTAPEFAAGTPYVGFFEVKLNDQNQALLAASVDDPTVSSSVDQALVRLDIGPSGALLGESVVVAEGNFLPGVSEAVSAVEGLGADLALAPQHRHGRADADGHVGRAEPAGPPALGDVLVDPLQRHVAEGRRQQPELEAEPRRAAQGEGQGDGVVHARIGVDHKPPRHWRGPVRRRVSCGCLSLKSVPTASASSPAAFRCRRGAMSVAPPGNSITSSPAAPRPTTQIEGRVRGRIQP